MRIYTLKGKEKDSFVKALPDDTDLSDSLIIASDDDEAEDVPVVGLMVLSASAPSAWSLDYLMVAESYRLRGVAKSLISYGRFLIQMMGGLFLTTRILVEDDKEDSEALMKCLMNSGFSIVDEKNVSAVSVDSICDKLSPYVEHADTKKIVPLSRIKEAMWEEIASTLPEMLLVEELFVPLHELDYYNKDLSMVMLDASGLCRGLILISDIEEDYSVDYIWSYGRKGMITMSLLVASLKKVKKECNVLFDAQTELGQRLAEKLFGSDVKKRYRALDMVLSL